MLKLSGFSVMNSSHHSDRVGPSGCIAGLVLALSVVQQSHASFVSSEQRKTWLGM